MEKKMYVYNYDKEFDEWDLRMIIHFNEFDDGGFESSTGLVINTGHNEYPKQKYVATVFKGKNTKITISENGLEEVTIYEHKEVR